MVSDPLAPPRRDPYVIADEETHMAMQAHEIETLLRAEFPDAQIEVSGR